MDEERATLVCQFSSSSSSNDKNDQQRLSNLPSSAQPHACLSCLRWGMPNKTACTRTTCNETGGLTNKWQMVSLACLPSSSSSRPSQPHAFAVSTHVRSSFCCMDSVACAAAAGFFPRSCNMHWWVWEWIHPSRLHDELDQLCEHSWPLWHHLMSLDIDYALTLFALSTYLSSCASCLIRIFDEQTCKPSFVSLFC